MPSPEGARIRLLLLGDGGCKAALKAQAAAAGLKNVRFADTVPKDEVVRWWSLLDVSIIHLRKTELFTAVIPSKLFECMGMGMGIPVLHGVAGESADIVRREGVGEVFEPESVDRLVDALLRLANDPDALTRYRANGLAAAERYDRVNLAGEMLTMLQETSGLSTGSIR